VYRQVRTAEPDCESDDELAEMAREDCVSEEEGITTTFLGQDLDETIFMELPVALQFIVESDEDDLGVEPVEDSEHNAFLLQKTLYGLKHYSSFFGGAFSK
jgi:hypothetical protein